jgi:hypothetical protein
MINYRAYKMTVTKLETNVTKTRTIKLDKERLSYYKAKIGIPFQGFLIKGIYNIE